MDNQETSVDRAELEAEAAQMMGAPQGQPQEAEQTESTSGDTSASSDEVASEESGATEVATEAEPALQLNEEEKALLGEFRKLTNVDGTPFKSVGALKDGYKNLQGQWTKTQERMRQHERFLSRLESDQQYRQYVEQLDAMVDNPQLAQAILAQKFGVQDTMPDPLQYDISDPAQHQKYMQDVTAYNQRQVNGVINARLSQMEQKAQMDTLRSQFQMKRPDIQNPDELLDWVSKNIREIGAFEAAYRMREFDNLRAKALEDAKRELLSKVQEAGKTTTPASTAPPAKKISADDVLKAIDTLGVEGAKKKYGKERVLDALEKDAARLMEM